MEGLFLPLLTERHLAGAPQFRPNTTFRGPLSLLVEWDT
jgi:hypothetical protein